MKSVDGSYEINVDLDEDITFGDKLNLFVCNTFKTFKRKGQKI